MSVKKVEELLANLNKGLENKVEERTAKLSSSEKLYRSLFENMMHGFTYCKVLFEDGHAVDYIYLAVNRAYESFTGLKDLVGQKLSVAIPGLRESDPHIFEAFGRVSTTGKPEKFEQYIRQLDKWFAITMYSTEMGYFVGLIDDITERKRIEAHQVLLASIINSSDDAILSKTLEGTITSWNPGAERLFGYEAAEVLGKNVSIIIPTDRLGEEPEIISKIKGGMSVDHYETQRRRKDGSLVDISLTVSPIRDSLGYIVGASKIARNISERRATEEKLEASERRFRTLIESSADGIALISEDAHLAYQSPSVARIMGYTFEERRTNPTQSNIHPEDLAGFLKLGEQVKNNPGQPIAYQYRFRHKNGHYIWLEGVLTNWLHDPTVRAVVANFRDVTARKDAEQKLIESEYRFRALIENSSDAIVLTDESSHVIYQSPSVTRILGYTLEERKLKPADNNVHPESREEFLKLSGKLIANPGHPVPFQYRFRHKMGHFIWLEGFVTNLLDDPNVNAIVANFREITERKVAEENLELTLRRFRLAQKIAHLGHWEMDFVTQRVIWSDETFRIFGLNPGSIEPTEKAFMQLIHPEDLGRVENAIAHSRQTLGPFSEYHRIVLNNGTTRNLLSTGQYEFDKAKNPLRLYGISLDVTEITDKEKKLEQVNHDLGTFIYKASHDLRSPIASILGLVHVAKAEVRDQKAVNYFSMINEVALKQNKMLVNLIKVMTIRDQMLVLEPVDLDAVLNEVVASLQPPKDCKKIQFNLRQEIRNSVRTDRGLMVTILFQLIENSILYAREDDPEINIRISKDAHENIVLEVSDNGIGIPKESLRMIFNMFYRASIFSRGSGLGLYLVKNAVDKLGGSIKVASIENEGSTFTIVLPLVI